MLADDIRIVSITEDNKFDPDTGDRKAIIRVMFRVGRNGPFTERFLKDTYTADVRDAKLNDYASHVRVAPSPESL